MAPDTWFEGLDAQHRSEYEAEARRRWGDAAVDAGDVAIRRMSPAERRAVPGRFASIHRRLAELRGRGRAAEDAAVQEVVAEHYALVASTWGTDPEERAYRGLGELYVDSSEFGAVFDDVAAGLGPYLRDAMHAWADRHLAS